MIVCTIILDENLGQIWVVNLAIPPNLRQGGTVPHTYTDSQSTGLVTTSCDPSSGCQLGDMLCQLLQICLEPHLVCQSPSSTMSWTINGTESIRLIGACNCHMCCGTINYSTSNWLQYDDTYCSFVAGILPLLVWQDIIFSLDPACIHINLIIQ